MNEGVLAISGFFTTVVVVVLGIAAGAAYRQRERQLTLRAAVAQGQSISALLAPEPSPRGRDLRRGILLISAGLGSLPAVWTLAPTKAFLSLVVLPIALGLGHLIAHRVVAMTADAGA
jgi:Domain of unknown function (DUF6249)